ncbi:hypothetical protein [Bradyrhizobium sp. CSA207]|uniref:hypothetical protein n=1 Tax=Bradyrhizobium sp. CSA207 TaxID=2698826 RepID=UPI0023AFE6DE|nr:hypothetical protein [Bradyrhizobium sp. CSA207]
MSIEDNGGNIGSGHRDRRYRFVAQALCAGPRTTVCLTDERLRRLLEDFERLICVQSFYEDAPIRSLGTSSIDGVMNPSYQILLVGMAVLAVVGLRVLINHIRLGRLITAVVSDREMA